MSWISNLFTGHKDNDKDKDKKQAKGKDKKKTEKQELTPEEKANGIKTAQICLIIICPVVFGTYYLIKQAVTANKKKENKKNNKNGKPPSHINDLIKSEQPELQQYNLSHAKNSFADVNANNQNISHEEQQFSNGQNQMRNQKVRQQKNEEEEEIGQENYDNQEKRKSYGRNDALDDDEEEEETQDVYHGQRVNRNSSYSDDEEENMEETYASTKNSFAKNENFTDNYSETNENQYNSLEQNSFTENNHKNVNQANENVGYSADKVDENYGRRNYIEKVRNYGQQSRGNDPPEQVRQEDFNQQYENYPEKEINNQSVNRRLTKHYDLNTCNDARCKRCGGYRYH